MKLLMMDGRNTMRIREFLWVVSIFFEQGSFLFYKLNRFDVRGKEIVKTQEKITDYNARYLITMDKEERSYNGIQQLNAIKWLLGG